MATAQWIKALAGHAGELYVAAELSKRGIPNALLPEGFPDHDILISTKDGGLFGYIQVKSCHPDRGNSFLLTKSDEKWAQAGDNQFVVFVYLGSPKNNEGPEYWMAPMKEVGEECRQHSAHGTDNWERRFPKEDLRPEWKNNWELFKDFCPK